MIEVVFRIGGFLTLVGTVLALLALLVLLAVGTHALVSGARARARRVAGLALSVIGAYLVVVVAYAASSRERLIARGDEKWICDVDCDLAYSVADVRVASSLGGVTAAPGSRLWVVSVRTRSDAARVTFDVSGTRSWVIDATGRRYAPRSDAQAAVERTAGARAFSRPLGPGESTVDPLVFELPDSARDPRLLVTLGGWIACLVPGDESAPLHRKQLLRLT